jgi:hypothetical protein
MTDEKREEENEKPALSRRDFLRRAGSEAVKTGATFVPGAAVARAVLAPGTPDEDSDEKTNRLPAWLRSLSKWRAKGGGNAA